MPIWQYERVDAQAGQMPGTTLQVERGVCIFATLVYMIDLRQIPALPH
jgi:hypothetical protein